MRLNTAPFNLSAIVIALLAGGLALLPSACSRHESPEKSADKAPPAVQGERAQALGAAVDSIAAARCDREVRCNNVGSGKHYDSKDACLSSTRDTQQSDLNLTECPKGVDQKDLEECLDKIRKDDCNNPLDHITRITACRAAEICRG